MTARRVATPSLGHADYVAADERIVACPHVFPFLDTEAAGPMVLEIPPAEEGASITGSMDDAWQTAREDVGPAGVDKGKGGKFRTALRIDWSWLTS
jgi:hypothetical protein